MRFRCSHKKLHVLQDGTTDKLFHSLYNPIISRIVDVYNPGAIVLQCGADSLAADRLGNFSMTIAGACSGVLPAEGCFPFACFCGSLYCDGFCNVHL